MKKTTLKLIIDDIGQRIDTVIAEREKISRSAGAKLVEGGAVLVNSKNVAKNYKIRENDIIEITFGNRTLKICVLDVKEHVLKEDASSLYKVIT